MAEPIKCPFCGHIPTVEDCGTNRWFVRCQCGIAQDKLYHQRCDAVRAWNRRKSVTENMCVNLDIQKIATHKSDFSDLDELSSAQPEHLVKESGNLVKGLVNDCISRQAAIDAVHIQADDDGWWTGTVHDMEELLKGLPSAQPERMTNRQWIDFLSVQFDISRTSAKEMLHGMMQWKKEDNFKKLFNGGKT